MNWLSWWAALCVGAAVWLCIQGDEPPRHARHGIRVHRGERPTVPRIQRPQQIGHLFAAIVPHGASVSIRFPDRVAPDLDVLARLGMCPAPWVPLLRLLVQGRANVLITGGTGVGKTTLLKALLACCTPEERIVTVETDAPCGTIGATTACTRVPSGALASAIGWDSSSRQPSWAHRRTAKSRSTCGSL